VPVSLKEPEVLNPVKGVRLSTARAGLYKNREDLTLIEIASGSASAAVFTKNVFSAAPVLLARTHLHDNEPRYCLINSGNANAGTGERGYKDALITCDVLARHSHCKTEEILPFSTGVIGEYLPTDKITTAYSDLISSLDEDNWLAAARAIMTTDIVAKGISRTLTIDGQEVQITGIAKGSGMIRPDMATMLAFIATDASIESDLLNNLLGNAVENSFNRICVDGDTSTNDACVLIASGKSGVSISSDNNSSIEKMQEAIDSVCITLAQAIIRDGEGATKFISVKVDGGASQSECLEIAYDIATSPLVKTAMFASDPNWGRILAAVGRSREGQLTPSTISIFLNELCIIDHGEKAVGYTEEAGKIEAAKTEIEIGIDLGQGRYCETVWTCDLSHEYVKINAEYRS
jgi:glutamate N-acetyltransferase/amino-acid N-acetyltransferase